MTGFFVGGSALDDLPYGAKPKRTAFDYLMIALFIMLIAFAVVAVAGLIMAL